jgi:FtsP/CotA-like multicopper oxidase with cupredoxin domain
MATKMATTAAALLVCSLTAAGQRLDAVSSASSVCAPLAASDVEGNTTADEATLLQVGRRATEAAREATQLRGFQFWIHGQRHKKRQMKVSGDGRWNVPNPNNLTELRQPEQLRSPVLLKVQETNLSTPFIKKGSYAITRGYNGKVPGPMIVMRPGTTTYVRVVNELGKNTDHSGFCEDHHMVPHPLQALEGVGPISEHFCELNTTNFHTHGLHTSPLPGHDEVRKTRIEPGESFDFSFELPDYHMGGTHWYHPHVHSSTAVQAGGGMHGFIHVEDIPGHLPPFIEKMPQSFMFLSGVDMHLSTKFERLGSADKLPKTGPYGFWRWIPCGPGADVEAPEGNEEPEFQDCKEIDPLTEDGAAFWEKIGLKKTPFILVNGQWQPKLTVKAGEWQRLRIAHASIELTLDLGLANPELCRVGLLAKDGVYLEEGPRWLHGPISISSGNRADVAIACKCPKGVKSCGTWLMFQTAHHEGHEEVSGKVMYLHIKQDDCSHDLSLELPSYHLNRPCYMANLRGLRVHPNNVHQLSLPCDFEPRCGKYNVTYDGVSHTTPSTALIDTLQLGTLYEWNFFHGVQYHPLHLHVTPFQITEIGPFFEPFYQDFVDDEYKYNNFFQVGDWHDVLRMPHRESCKLRLLPNTFTGEYMLHCHFLDHEDAGLMGYFKVKGKEGTRNDCAQKHDPQCFWNSHEAGWRLSSPSSNSYPSYSSSPPIHQGRGSSSGSSSSSSSHGYGPCHR